MCDNALELKLNIGPVKEISHKDEEGNDKNKNRQS